MSYQTIFQDFYFQTIIFMILQQIRTAPLVASGPGVYPIWVNVWPDAKLTTLAGNNRLGVSTFRV